MVDILGTSQRDVEPDLVPGNGSPKTGQATPRIWYPLKMRGNFVAIDVNIVVAYYAWKGMDRHWPIRRRAIEQRAKKTSRSGGYLKKYSFRSDCRWWQAKWGFVISLGCLLSVGLSNHGKAHVRIADFSYVGITISLDNSWNSLTSNFEFRLTFHTHHGDRSNQAWFCPDYFESLWL